MTITLGNGQSVSGRVTADTKIECEDEDEDTAMAAHDGGDDNSGPGSSSSGREEENEVENEVEDEDRACETDALKQGATVKEAEAKLTSNGLVFEEIELA